MAINRLLLKNFWTSKNSLILILLLGFAIRLHQLGGQSLWYDETVSAFLANQPVAELVAHTARDIHPPGYYLLLHFWVVAAGDTEFALAFFSVVFGLLLIPLTNRLAQYLANRATGRWAAFLVAISPYHLWYSQEVRMYTLAAGLGVVATYSLLKGLRPKGHRRYWVGYITAATLGLYILYYFAFLLVALNIYLLVCLLYPKIKTGPLKGLTIANGLVLLAYLPWLPIAWQQATNPPVPPWRSPPALPDVLTESWSALSLGQSVNPATVWPVLLVSLALFLVGISRLNSTRPFRLPINWGTLLLTYTFGPLLIIYLLSFVTPLYHVRYLFTYAPAFYIVLGTAFFWLTKRTPAIVPAISLVILAGASLFSMYRYYVDPQADDYRAAVDFIEQQWQPGDALLVNAGYTYTAFVYYADLPRLERRRLVPYRPPDQPRQPLLFQTGIVNGSPQLGWGNPRSDFYAMPAAQTTQALQQLANDYPRLWMLRAYDTVTDPTALIRTWLAQQATPLEDEPFSGPSNIRVQGFLLHSPPPPPENGPVYFEDGMLLAGWQRPSQNWRAGQTIPLKLWWSTTTKPATNYKASLKLWTAAGQLAAQGQDDWPVGSLYRATDWPTGQTVYHPTQLTLPQNLPAGQYWLNVELYHPQTIQPLPRSDNGEPFVTLGPLLVEP